MNTNNKNYKDHLKEIILKSKILILLLKIINFFLNFFNRIPHLILESDFQKIYSFPFLDKLAMKQK